MQVQITEKFFETVKAASMVDSRIMISKGIMDDGTKTPIVQVGVKNAAKSFFLSLECPATECAFDGNTIAFMDFKEFSNIVSTLESPTLSQDPKDPTSIEIVKASTKIKYKLADASTLPPWFKVPDFDTKDSVLVTSDDMKHILNTFALTGTSVLTATVNGSKLDLEFTGDKSLHKANDFMNLEADSKEKNYSISLMKDLLMLIPKGVYKMLLNPDATHAQFELVDDTYQMRIACQSMV